MSKQIFRLKINLDKINESRAFRGKKGNYIDVSMIETPNGYNEYMLVQDVSKEERKQNVDGEIIGNADEYIREQSDRIPNDNNSQDDSSAQAAPDQNLSDDDIPF